MTRFAALIVAAALVAPSAARAQSSWGLSVNSTGTLVFCDDARGRVWMVEHGTASEIMDNTYCHAVITMDEGVAHGEALLPTSSTTFSRALWRLGPTGQPQFTLGPTTSPDSSEWLVRDPDGRMYAWNGVTNGSQYSQITRRAPDGSVQRLAGDVWGQRDGTGTDAALGRVAGLALRPDGTLLVLDSGNLREIDPDGRVRTLARAVATDRPGAAKYQVGLWNQELGIASDLDGSALIVDPVAGRVLRVDRLGRRNVVWQSGGIADLLTSGRWGWRPEGVARQGDAYFVLDAWPLPGIFADLVGSPRVYRVGLDGSVSSVVAIGDWITRGEVLLAIIVLWSIYRGWSRARRRAPAAR